MKVGIIGFGVVGRAMGELFDGKAKVYIFDPNIAGLSGKEEINNCNVAFVCVPTPMKEDGYCDTSLVEEAVGWIDTPLIIIRSTISVGTTKKLEEKYPYKNIVFQPEYVGETTAHPLADEKVRQFVILGGKQEARKKAIKVYQEVYNASVKFYQSDGTTAEVAKYMENSFIGAYVVFCNEFFEISKTFGADYNEVRELFLADPRMTPYWTFVYEKARGFNGKCLPKDINAICASMRDNLKHAPFMESVLKNNDYYGKNNSI